jgi:hypothetical protein
MLRPAVIIATNRANSPHCVVNSSRAQTALDDFKTSALTQHHVRRWDPNVLESDFRVAMRGVVVAVNGKHTFNLDARSSRRHQNDRLLLVWVLVVWICLS